jgi:hypothetical protein
MTIHLIGGREGTGKSTLSRTLNFLGYPAIDADTHRGLTVWVNASTGAKVHERDVSYPVSELWVRSHRWVWDPQKMHDLIQLYEGREAFLCGSKTANEADFYPLFGLRFYLWAQDGVILRRLQERDPSLWHYGSRELIERLVDNDNSRTEAIMNGSVVLSAEWTVEQLADTIIAYISAARSPESSLRFGSDII